MRTVTRDKSGPTEVACISNDERRKPFRFPYSLV